MKDNVPRDIAPLDTLYLHPFNPRQVATEEQIEAKAASMATTVGLMHNLLAYEDPERDGLGIVGGGLRLRGLQKLAEEGWSRHPDQLAIDPVPVQVTSDPIIARAWALGENVSREELTPVQEVRAYAAMAENGGSAELIARAFGKTARHVARRLALAQLPETALNALEKGEISLDVARALTIARSPKALDETLSIAIKDGWGEFHVRSALTSKAIKSDDWRVLCVGLEAYFEDGGTATEDLFQDMQLLHDEGKLDKLFKKKLEAAAREIEKEGWAEVRLVTDFPHVDHSRTGSLQRLYPEEIELPEADAEELEELEELGWQGLNEEGEKRIEELRARTRGDFTDDDIERGIVFVYADRDGEIQASRAWAQPKSKSKGSDSVDVSGGGEKPAMTQAVLDDLSRLRLAALMGELVDKTELLLDLLAYQMECAVPAYRGAFNVALSHAQIEPSQTDSVHIDKRVTDVPAAIAFMAKPNLEGFDAFREKGKKHRNQVLASHLARSINSLSSGGLVKELEAEHSPGLRKVWHPTEENFFNRVRSDYLERIWADLLDLEEDADSRTQFAKLSKRDKAAELEDLFHNSEAQEARGLSREQIKRIDEWVPEIPE